MKGEGDVSALRSLRGSSGHPGRSMRKKEINEKRERQGDREREKERE